MNNRRIITCDIDGILTDYPKCWLEFLYGKCGVRYESIELAKQSEPNYRLYKDQYRNSAFKGNLVINEHNKSLINILATDYDIVFATSRPINSSKYPDLYRLTFDWLKKNGVSFKSLVFKDKEGKFLNDLNPIYHIDDEVEYCNIAAKYFQTLDINNRGYAFLLGDIKSIQDEIDCNVIVGCDLNDLLLAPFFSICIPATNREKTIYRALKSISEQKFRNFEVVIVDCNSKDHTINEINRFFSSNDYTDHYFKYILKKINIEFDGTADWNEPLKYAKGKYIAMLEGDDYWLPNHLGNAYLALISNDNIGVYGSSSNQTKRRFNGLLSNEKSKRYCFLLKDGVVPPSESVFIRVGNGGRQYLYNSNDYNYSPEIALYMDIMIDGYDLFYTKVVDVYREPSTNKNKMKTWEYFSNRFVFIEKYSKHFSPFIILMSKIYNSFITLCGALRTKSISNFCKSFNNVSNEVGVFIVFLVIVPSFVFTISTHVSSLIIRKLK